MREPMTSPNQYAVAESKDTDFDLAAAEVAEQLSQSLSNPDLLGIFSCGYPEEKANRFPEHFEKLGSKVTFGSNCMGVIGNEHEMFNGEPALVAWAASMPETKIQAFHLSYDRAEGGAFVGWPDDPGALDDETVLLSVADPYSFPMDILLARLNEDRPNVSVIGGMASGSARPGEWNFYYQHELKNEGAAFVALSGKHLPIPLVSQACRPIGSTMIITGCERNVIHTLGGKPAVEQLFSMFDQLPTREQKQVNNGLQMGLAVTEYKDQFGYGDFLIRNVLGIDRQTGAITVGDFTRVGQTCQFHVRDHETANLDLVQACADVKKKSKVAQSALVFSCNGRGPNMFPEPDHDPLVLRNELGLNSVAGFFAAGEFGPVGKQNFLHGFTASVAIFI